MISQMLPSETELRNYLPPRMPSPAPSSKWHPKTLAGFWITVVKWYSVELSC